MEHKTATAFETKVADEGIVETIFAVMGNVDLGNDMIHPGAFAKTFSERGRKVKVLDHHQAQSVRDVIGKPLELRELSRAELPEAVTDAYPEATGGAWAKVQFLMDTPEGDGAFKRIKAGVVNEWSFGYDALDHDFSTVKQDEAEVTVRNLRTLKLYELSPVIWGMNPATGTVSAKAGEPEPEPDDTGVKEMVGDTPHARLGDVLQGSIHKIFTTLADSWYVEGYMDREERIFLSSLIGDALDILSNGIPAEMATRHVYPFAVMGRTLMTEEKAEDFEWLSDLKGDEAEWLRERMSRLDALLEQAEGQQEQNHDAPPTEGAAEDTPTEDAGPEIPPTSERMAIVDALTQEMDLLEV